MAGNPGVPGTADPPGGPAVTKTSVEVQLGNADRSYANSSDSESQSMMSESADPPGGPAPTTQPTYPLSPNIVVTSQNIINNQPITLESFASALTKDFVFPKKNQAIVFNAIDGIKLGDYIIALGPIVKSRNIMFASHMSNRRVCIYLSSVSIVDSFINNHAGINIANNFVQARRLISPAKRIIISNVSPCIPHIHLEAILKSNGLKVVSPISFMRVGSVLEEYKHVLSFRRQVYVVLENNDKLPETLLVEFEDEKYRIFLSTDEMRCFKCKAVGHISTNCPQTIQTPAESVAEVNHQTKVNDANVTPGSLTDTEHITEVSDPNPGFLVPRSSNALKSRRPSVSPTGKRSAEVLEREETSSLIDSECSTTSTSRTKPRMKKHKKIKAIKPTREKQDMERSDNESLKASIEMFTDGSTHTLTYSELQEFLTECKGTEKKLEIAQKYTSDIAGLTSLLDGVIKKLGNGALKERCKRLVFQLTKSLKTNSD